jgi:2-keto-4-pentenoate hydratase/2-oxohepta-3-ene-1,7-dioic acid hydratase in catechol pathway
MKFVTFEVTTPVGPVERTGLLRDGTVIDLNAACATYLREARGVWRWKDLACALVPTDMMKLIENGPVAIETIHRVLEYFDGTGSLETGEKRGKLLYNRDEIRLLAPVPRPVSLRDCSAFIRHIMNGPTWRGKEVPQVFFEIPSHYRGSATDVIGHEDPILWPAYSEQLDYELEFAVCIGKYGVNIPPEKVEEYIFGYTIFNDVSARDMQQKEKVLGLGPMKGKSFRNSNVLGPCLVTPDELNVDNLRMTAKINGELWSEGNSADMYFKFPQLISYLSKEDPLYPGEFIGSGTVGTGCGGELNRWIKPGDVIEFEVEGIGILRNSVVRKREGL